MEQLISDNVNEQMALLFTANNWVEFYFRNYFFKLHIFFNTKFEEKNIILLFRVSLFDIT